MSDDYDVFGTLNDLCTTNTYEELKGQFPSEESRNYDDDDLELKLDEIQSITKLQTTKVKPKVSKKKEAAPVKEKSPAELALPKLTKKVKTNKKSKDAITIDDSAENLLSETLNSRPRTRSAANANATVTETAPATTTGTLLESIILHRSTLENIANNLMTASTSRVRGRKRNTAATTTTTWDDTTNMPPLFAGTALAAPRPKKKTTKQTKNNTNTRSARQTYISEVAARSTNVGYVDLVTAPLPRIDDVINVDSDIDEQDSLSQTQNDVSPTAATLDDSYVEENPELSIKVVWKGFPEVFKMRKYQKFAYLYNKLAEREQTATEHIVFNIDNRVIMPDDTPQSIEYKIYQFITGRVWEQKGDAAQATLACQKQKKKRGANCIRLKIQSDRWKKPLQVEMLKTETCKILYIKCSEELNMAHDCFHLSFDGELLEHTATPLDLELEGGELIDLIFKK